MSPILAMPTTTVVKMIGAIIILISLMKPSPRGFIAVACAGRSTPSSTPTAMATSTWKYRWAYRGWRAGADVRPGPAPVVGCMTIASEAGAGEGAGVPEHDGRSGGRSQPVSPDARRPDGGGA